MEEYWGKDPPEARLCSSSGSLQQKGKKDAQKAVGIQRFLSKTHVFAVCGVVWSDLDWNLT